MMIAPLKRVLGFLNSNLAARLTALSDSGSQLAPPAMAPGMFESLESRQLMSTIVFTPGHNQTVTNANGNVVVFSLTGKGQGELVVSDSGVFESVTLSGTTSASSMNVTVTGTAQSGTVTIGAIQVGSGSMNAINAAKVNLQGTLKVDATITSVTLGNATDSTLSLFKGNTAAGPMLKLGNVLDSSLSVTGLLGTIDVNSWSDTGGVDDTIAAVAIGRVVSRGDFDVSLKLTANPTASQATLGSVSVVGEVREANWHMTGSIGAISVGSAVGVSVLASKITSLAASKNGFIETVVTAGQLGTFSSRGDVEVVKLIINSDGTPAPLNFRAISTVTVTGNANHLSITSTDANSGIGAVNISGNLTDFHANIAGDMASLAANNASDLTITAGSLGSLGLRASGSDFDVTAGKINLISIAGDLTNADVEIKSGASKTFQALGTFKVVGTTSQLDIESANAFANFGSLTLVNSLDSGKWQIAGNVGLISTNGTLGNLVFTGKSVNSVSVGSLNKVEMNALSLGTFKAAFVVTDFNLTLNAGWPAQPSTFKALGSFTSTGKADHLTISGVAANSNFGAFTFTQGLSNAVIKLNGNGSTFTSPGITSVVLETGKMSTVTLKGDVASSSFKATWLTSVTVTGDVAGLGLNVNSAGSTNRAFSALGTVSVSGDAANLEIVGSGVYSNVGSITVTGDVTAGKFNINGNVSKIAAKSFDEATTGSVTGVLTNFSTTGFISTFDGTYHVKGGISKLTSSSVFSATVSAEGNIGPVTVNTTMNKGVIRTTGSIGAVNIGFMNESTILSGFRADAELPVGIPLNHADFINPNATMGTVTIRIVGFPPAPSFIRSVIGGNRLGVVLLKRVSTEGLEGGDANFGIVAAKSITNVVGVGLPLLQNLTGTGIKYQDGHFVVRIV